MCAAAQRRSPARRGKADEAPFPTQVSASCARGGRTSGGACAVAHNNTRLLHTLTPTHSQHTDWTAPHTHTHALTTTRIDLHSIRIQSASNRHPIRIQSASNLHPICIQSASNLHPICFQSASNLHPILPAAPHTAWRRCLQGFPTATSLFAVECFLLEFMPRTHAAAVSSQVRLLEGALCTLPSSIRIQSAPNLHPICAQSAPNLHPICIHPDCPRSEVISL